MKVSLYKSFKLTAQFVQMNCLVWLCVLNSCGQDVEIKPNTKAQVLEKLCSKCWKLTKDEYSDMGVGNGPRTLTKIYSDSEKIIFCFKKDFTYSETYSDSNGTRSYSGIWGISEDGTSFGYSTRTGPIIFTRPIPLKLKIDDFPYKIEKLNYFNFISSRRGRCGGSRYFYQSY